MWPLATSMFSCCPGDWCARMHNSPASSDKVMTIRNATEWIESDAWQMCQAHGRIFGHNLLWANPTWGPNKKQLKMLYTNVSWLGLRIQSYTWRIAIKKAKTRPDNEPILSLDPYESNNNNNRHHRKTMPNVLEPSGRRSRAFSFDWPHFHSSTLTQAHWHGPRRSLRFVCVCSWMSACCCQPFRLHALCLRFRTSSGSLKHSLGHITFGPGGKATNETNISHRDCVLISCVDWDVDWLGGNVPLLSNARHCRMHAFRSMRALRTH